MGTDGYVLSLAVPEVDTRLRVLDKPIPGPAGEYAKLKTWSKKDTRQRGIFSQC